MNPIRAGRRKGVSAVRFGALACVLAATACTTTRSPYVVRRNAEVPVHVVQRGETLYTIAWQYRVDQRNLVAWNVLDDPDRLRVGQRLRLVPPRGWVEAAPVAARTPRAAPAVARPPTPAPRSPVAPPRTPQPAGAPAWSWPTEGRVVATFGARDGIASGVAIAGREGQPVRAAAAGRVVYAGGGLIGYGQLVIIKHDDTFLSAYGYNNNLLVTQGQDVARGATIALMGQGPERQARLHFEIRRDGVPVDPLLFVTAPR